MKNIFLLLLFVSPLYFNGQARIRLQPVSTTIDTVQLKAQPLSEATGSRTASFNFTLFNSSDRTITFDKELIVTDTGRYRSPDIIMEIDTTKGKEGPLRVVYCNICFAKDGLRTKENIADHVQILKPGESTYIQATASCFSFVPGEIYTIRFSLNPKVTGLYGKTDWMEFQF